MFEDISKNFSHLSQLLRSGRYGNFTEKVSMAAPDKQGKEPIDAPDEYEKKHPIDIPDKSNQKDTVKNPNKRAKKDRRSMNGYIIYGSKARPKLKAENPQMSFREITTMLNHNWLHLDPKEKDVRLIKKDG